MTASHTFRHRTVAVLALAAIASHAAAGWPAQRIHVVDDSRYRAIFCGDAGTETSAAYSRALARDLKRLETAGHTAAQSMALIRAKACRAGDSWRAP